MIVEQEINKRNKDSPLQSKGAFIVMNDRGLHTRPSIAIVKCTTGYKSDITLTYKRTEVNARSLLGILMLAAEKGSKIRITATGADAEKAVAALVDLAQRGFDIKY
jgi:phosphocarrier protein